MNKNNKNIKNNQIYINYKDGETSTRNSITVTNTTDVDNDVLSLTIMILLQTIHMQVIIITSIMYIMMFVDIFISVRITMPLNKTKTDKTIILRIATLDDPTNNINSRLIESPP